MFVEKLDARYVHLKNAQVRLEKYTDGSLALVGEDADEDGMPNVETLSLNLSAYGMYPPEGHVFIKDYADGEGVADALASLGIVKIVEALYFGPFGSRAYLVKLSDSILFDREEAR